MGSTSLKRNFLWNASYQVLLILVPLVTTPYLARVLGASQVGVFSYTNSITNYFVLFITLGMGQYGVRIIAQAGDDRGARSRVFASAYAAQLVFALPVSVVYIAYLFSSPSGGYIIALSWGMWVIAATIDISWLFFGVEEFRMPTMRSAATKLASVFVILALVKEPDDLWIYVAAIAGSYLANAVLLWPFLGRYVDRYIPRWKEIKEHFVPNIRLFAPVVACSMYLMLDKILLAAMAGTVEAGYYEYSEKLAKMPTSVVTALGTVMLPHMTAMLARGEKEQVSTLLNQCFWVMEGVALGIMFGIAAIAPEFTAVFLGPEFEPCKHVIPVLSITIPIIAASNVIGVQYMLPKGMDKEYSASVWAGAIVNVSLCILLLGHFGAFGASMATVLTEGAVLAFQCWCVRRELPLIQMVFDTAPFFIIGFGMLALVRIGAHALSVTIDSWLILPLEIGVGVVAYGLAALVWCKWSGRIDFIKRLIKR